MRDYIRFTVLGAALMAGAPLASAQSVIANQPIETMIAQQPGSMLIAQEPMSVPPQSIVVRQPAPATVPLQTVETVRTTVQSTTTSRRRVAGRPLRTVTTTRTTVREHVVPAPMVAAAPVAPAVRAIAQPGYTEVVAAPGAALTYPAPLYDVVPGAAVAPLTSPAPTGVFAQPAAGGVIVTSVPAYRYIYEPDRILVIDANSGIAVQAIPR
jgi:hypothetical protein